MCRCSLMVAIWIGVLACGLHAQPAGEAFYKDLSLLPYVYSGVESYYLSSYDRTGGNDDGFRGTYSQLYVDDNGEHVIFDEKGPGCIYNLWFTGSDQDLHWGRFGSTSTMRSRLVSCATGGSSSTVRSVRLCIR